MSHRTRFFVLLALVMPLLTQVTVAQKPPAPAPAPPPPSATPNPANSPPLRPEANQPTGDLVMFLRGSVATDDGTPVPSNVMVERVCNNRVNQQVYASPHGDFSMQLGSRTDAFLDASADPAPQSGAADKGSPLGISRRELWNCEVRASASGFQSRVVNLTDLDNFGGNVDVGTIVVHRMAKIRGMTLRAGPYEAPKDARKAYEKGLRAESNGKLAEAHKFFETAVEIHSRYADAWFRLGTVLQKENQMDAARSAFMQATTIDNKFLPPYLSLASMAYEAQNWTEVLAFTGHILDLDPLNRSAAGGYIVDLDASNSADAYFYNAVANYRLDRIEDAEKSGLKAEHILPTHFPQVHVLLAEIFVRKKDYPTAISELQTYLELLPHGENADQIRAQLAKLQELNHPAPAGDKPDPR